MKFPALQRYASVRTITLELRKHEPFDVFGFDTASPPLAFAGL